MTTDQSPPAQASDCATCEGHGEVSVKGSDEPMREYRVGWFWSSANPGKKVRCLAEGKEIFEYEKRGDFIEWCDSPRATADVERIDFLAAHPELSLTHHKKHWALRQLGLNAEFEISRDLRAAIDAAIAATKGAKT